MKGINENMSVDIYDDESRVCNIEFLLNNRSQIKIKERTNFSIGYLFSLRSKKITESCYAEWRVGYSGNNFELMSILIKFCEYGFFNKDALCSLKKSIETNESFISTSLDYKIADKGMILSPLQLEYNEKENVHSSLFLQKDEYDSCYIELCSLKQQKVNGYQPFLHVCIPITKITSTTSSTPLIGRSSDKGEKGRFTLTEANKVLIIDVIKTFSIINKNYKSDMLELISDVIATVYKSPCPDKQH